MVTDDAIRAAIDGWQLWEDAVHRTNTRNMPEWTRYNGRRWAAEPGE